MNSRFRGPWTDCHKDPKSAQDKCEADGDCESVLTAAVLCKGGYLVIHAEIRGWRDLRHTKPNIAKFKLMGYQMKDCPAS
eukprot:CAMPEP_0197667440 /NCGR_PEP_ID=MMETSP1338-20131121/66409_1 /TAXON_ID=43686 ORGANISM="Pelagodinium beii, Strain RCC1491" /NCGR_SAMPLE_ID=MMETSP1338 /ASSEMBLY_ACC=CAM_ASM_000754 /LENGTH=79 /DNA_ID=CAMNT_0043246677 /DNA_START=24 /DNA_END=260 /DNA_ORIENTATION=-